MGNVTACARNGLVIRDPAIRAAYEKMADANERITREFGRKTTPEAVARYKQVTRDFLADLNRARAGPQTESIAKN